LQTQFTFLFEIIKALYLKHLIQNILTSRRRHFEIDKLGRKVKASECVYFVNYEYIRLRGAGGGSIVG
jgi:hypothetical protein